MGGHTRIGATLMLLLVLIAAVLTVLVAAGAARNAEPLRRVRPAGLNA
jgi:hypothetical protein